MIRDLPRNAIQSVSTLNIGWLQELDNPQLRPPDQIASSSVPPAKESLSLLFLNALQSGTVIRLVLMNETEEEVISSVLEDTLKPYCVCSSWNSSCRITVQGNTSLPRRCLNVCILQQVALEGNITSTLPSSTSSPQLLNLTSATWDGFISAERLLQELKTMLRNPYPVASVTYLLFKTNWKK